jgi:hypothetical protein
VLRRDRIAAATATAAPAARRPGTPQRRCRLRRGEVVKPRPACLPRRSRFHLRPKARVSGVDRRHQKHHRSSTYHWILLADTRGRTGAQYMHMPVKATTQNIGMGSMDSPVVVRMRGAPACCGSRRAFLRSCCPFHIIRTYVINCIVTAPNCRKLQ